jgi:radical SAM protein with 4Fe4S-binding SPASM domain
MNTGSFDIDQKTKLNIKPVEMKRCLRPWTNITIDEFGVVKPCHRIWQKYGKIIGNKGGVTIWNNHKYKQLRRNVNCAPSPTCAGCRLSAYNDENSYANTILSPGRKDLLRKIFTIKKANKIAFVD